jgi:uncharacterized membrane protein YkoI
MEDGMKNRKFVLLSFIVLLAMGLILLPSCAPKESEQGEESGEQAETQEMEGSEAAEPVTELPDAVLQAIAINVPGAEIETAAMAVEEGITLYDIEFKEDRGEIEVAEDGTVIDVVTIVTMEDLPEAAALTIQKAAEGTTIKRLEKSEVRSEIKKEGEVSTIVKLDVPRYVYEAELEKDGQTGEITVDAEGNIVEPLKWDVD